MGLGIVGILGEIRMWAGQPSSLTGAVEVYPGWLLCNGAVVLTSSYPDLAGVLGTAYNTGGEIGGQVRLPNLQQRFPMGQAQSGAGNVRGGTGGALTVALTTATMPAHQHGGVTTTNGAHSHLAAVGNLHATAAIIGVQLGGTAVFNPSEFGLNTLVQPAGDHAHVIPAEGSSQAHENTPPFQVVNYVVKY
jgi:microcystin-dependent protein